MLKKNNNMQIYIVVKLNKSLSNCIKIDEVKVLLELHAVLTVLIIWQPEAVVENIENLFMV